MPNQIFRCTTLAYQEITKASDMAWALSAGLLILRELGTEHYQGGINTTENKENINKLKNSILRRVNLKKIIHEFTWEYEEQYLAQLFLVNAIAIFDTWVDTFVDAALLNISTNKRKTVKARLKRGDFQALDNYLVNEKNSSLAQCFEYDKTCPKIKNLILIYKYFKLCRNCCAHGNQKFTMEAEKAYDKIKSLTNHDCNIKEFPQIANTTKDKQFKLFLRGVIGFYDTLLRIISHYDTLAADKVAIELELIEKIKNLKTKQLNTFFISNKKINITLTNYLISAQMPPPKESHMHNIYIFLQKHNFIK